MPKLHYKEIQRIEHDNTKNVEKNNTTSRKEQHYLNKQ